MSLRVVDWNVEKQRGPKTVAHELARLSRDADVLLLQEVQGYGRVLDEVPGFHAVAFHDGRERDETAILVRDGLEPKATDALRVTSRGWFTVRGGKTPPKWSTVAVVQGVGFASVHTPPTVQTWHQRLRSPRRWRAYRELMASMPKVADHLGRAAVIAGDWNVDARSDHGRTGWPLRTFHGLRDPMRRHAPKTGTHGKRVIDYLFARGVHVQGLRVLSEHYGSDHRPIRFVVTKEKP